MRADHATDAMRFVVTCPMPSRSWSAADRLDEIEARANAAREVPWEWHVTEDRRWTYVTGANGTVIEHMADDDDADFIAHARTDVPALVAALRAVLELHHETTAWAPPDETQATECAQGCTDSEGFSDYPCPTVRAIEEALS